MIDPWITDEELVKALVARQEAKEIAYLIVLTIDGGDEIDVYTNMDEEQLDEVHKIATDPEGWEAE